MKKTFCPTDENEDWRIKHNKEGMNTRICSTQEIKNEIDWSCVLKRTKIPSKKCGFGEARENKTTMKTRRQMMGSGVGIRCHLHGDFSLRGSRGREMKGAFDEAKSQLSGHGID